MITQTTVTEHDLRRLLALVNEAAFATEAEVFPSSVLIGLHRIVPACDITFQLTNASARKTLSVDGLWVDPDGGVHDMNDGSDGVDDDMREAFATAFWEPGGCSYPQDTDDYTTVLSDTTDGRSDQERANSMMDDLLLQTGTRHEVTVPLPPHGFTDRRLLLFRDEDPAFSDREVLLLQIFRPHLIEVHNRHLRMLQGQPELTPRQWEILRQVASGASNTQVARALQVSEATVRKHLEHIFLRASTWRAAPRPSQGSYRSYTSPDLGQTRAVISRVSGRVPRRPAGPRPGSSPTRDSRLGASSTGGGRRARPGGSTRCRPASGGRCRSGPHRACW